jgi:TRAP-type transport system small permease protein
MTGRISHALNGADKGLQALNALVLCAMLLGMLACVFANVVSRYLFAVSFAWAEEAARFMMIWTVFLGAGLALRHGLHVAVTLLPDAVPPLRRPLFWISLAVTFTFFALLMRYGLDYALFASRQRSTILRLPMIWVYMAVPVGAGLALAHILLGLRAAPLWAGPAVPNAAGVAR